MVMMKRFSLQIRICISVYLLHSARLRPCKVARELRIKLSNRLYSTHKGALLDGRTNKVS